MSSLVQNLLEQSVGNGARPTKFELVFLMTNDEDTVNAQTAALLVKSTNVPTKTHQPIFIRYKGRNIPQKGQTGYKQTWDCTFYMTEDHKLKNAFELWMEALDEKHTYVNPSDVTNLDKTQKYHGENGYTTTLHLYQRDFDDENNTAHYILEHCFPTDISPMTMSYDAVGQVMEFTVTFTFSHFRLEVLKGKEGNFVDQLVSKLQDIASTAVKNTMTKIQDGINGYVSDKIAASGLTEKGDAILGKLDNVKDSLGNKSASEIPNSILNR